MFGYILLISWIYLCLYLRRTLTAGNVVLIQDINKLYAVLTSIGVIFITGFRHVTVGPDSDAYASYISNLNKGIYLIGYDRFEKGFEIFSKFIARFTGDYTIYFLIIATIIMALYGILLYRATKEYFWAIFLYITIGSFIFQLTGLRQALAMAFCAISMVFVKEKKIIPFILLVSLASQFHTAALCFLPLYFLGRIKPSLKSILLLITGIIAVLLANEWIMNTANSLLGYNKGYEDAAGGVVNIILYIGVIAVSALQYRFMFRYDESGNYDNLDDRSKYNVIALNMSIITFIMYFMRYWLRMSERAAKFYQIGIIILLANFISSIEDKKYKQIITFVVLILALGLFWYRQTRPNSQYIYRFVWQGT